MRISVPENFRIAAEPDPGPAGGKLPDRYLPHKIQDENNNILTGSEL